MIILLLAIIIVLVLVLRANVADNTKVLSELRQSLHQLQKEFRQLNTGKEEVKVPASPDATVPVQAGPERETPVFFTQVSTVSDDRNIPETSIKTESSQGPLSPAEQQQVPVFTSPDSRPRQIPEPPESWIERWLRNNPDMEKFIGENLVNKIGIAVLVLGIAFFVKYAIDKEWINEQGRTGIGLLCGGILIALAHRLRNSYRSFSSVLVGGGLSLFYFTIAIAFHEYQLIGQTPAFVIMVFITGFAVLLSVLYNRLELAVLATLGGFITPFLVSNGSNNHMALFTYLTVLNCGLIVLAYLRNWKALNYISLFFTIIIFGAWYADVYAAGEIPSPDAIVFATIFYVVFLSMNLVSQRNTTRSLRALDFGVLLIINTSYYAAGLSILSATGMADFKGIFTATLGILNLALAYTLFKSGRLHRNFIYLLIGLTITYISLTGPVQLEGNYITLFWAAEAVLLLWLYQRSFIKMLKLASFVVVICMTFSLFMDWDHVYNYYDKLRLPVILNKGFITTLSAAVSLSCLYLLMRKEADTFYLAGVTNRLIRNVYLAGAIGLLYFAGAIEINYQFITRYGGTGLNLVYLQLFTISLLTGLLIVADSLSRAVDDYLRLLATVIFFILYLANASNVYTTEVSILRSGNNTPHLFAWIFNAVAITAFLLHSFFYIIQNRYRYRPLFPAFVTILSLAIVVMISIEIRNAYIWSVFTPHVNIDYFENLYSKAFLSVIWGLSSFAMVWAGMKYRFKSLRISALGLFGLTLLKLFTFDIKNIPPGGKIIAFILLGILLLVISFMYQRLKKILIDHAETE
ncbi:MAG TPA: DUF2339 domain-containing protein [Chitinophagaceae bacterium]